MSRSDQYFQWTGNLLNGRRISFANSETTWEIVEKISEKTCQIQYPLPCESVTVFTCQQVSGKEVGQEAIMKVRLEIPKSRFPHPDPKQRGSPSKKVNVITLLEVDRLDKLTELGCTSTPHLIDYERMKQDDSMWMPGGYIVYMVMELLPGHPIYDFWTWSRPERDEVRKAFQTALEEIWRLSRLDPADPAPRNIIWHRKKQKCYIVDFEDCDDYTDKPEHELKFSDSDLFYWTLLRRDVATDQTIL